MLEFVLSESMNLPLEPTITYHDDGSKKHSVYYLDTLKDGEELYWDESGDVIGHNYWENGYKRQEFTKKKWDNGDISIFMRDDVLQLSQSSIDGIITIKKLMENGQYSVNSWWSDGNLKEERTELPIKGLFRDTFELHGERKSWFENKNQRELCHYDNGKLTGEYRSWYSDGSVKEESYYDHGERLGYYVIYDKKGEIIEEGQRSRSKSANSI